MDNFTATCILCPRGCVLHIDSDLNVTGNRCPKGIEYGKSERTAPKRGFSTTVAIEGGAFPRCPVKTDREIDKKLVIGAAKLAKNIKLKAPVFVGDIVLENLLDTGVNLVVSRDM